MKKMLILLAVAMLPAASGCCCARLCPCCPCNWFNRGPVCAPAPTYAAPLAATCAPTAGSLYAVTMRTAAVCATTMCAVCGDGRDAADAPNRNAAILAPPAAPMMTQAQPMYYQAQPTPAYYGEPSCSYAAQSACGCGSMGAVGYGPCDCNQCGSCNQCGGCGSCGRV